MAIDTFLIIIDILLVSGFIGKNYNDLRKLQKNLKSINAIVVLIPIFTTVISIIPELLKFNGVGWLNTLIERCITVILPSVIGGYISSAIIIYLITPLFWFIKSRLK